MVAGNKAGVGTGVGGNNSEVESIDLVSGSMDKKRRWLPGFSQSLLNG